eukprot:GHVH01015144.1.p1 GENE.GHVH01015144.1~~GHVH01015144.1.p1  ORF type:complete len:579 (-),score=47.26 GHVH01015144.1:1408-3144(-)
MRPRDQPIRTVLSGYGYTEWFTFASLSFIVWSIATAVEVAQGWTCGFFELYANRAESEASYTDAQYAFSTDKELSRMQYQTIRVGGLLEFTVSSLLSLTMVLLLKAEAIAYPYCLSLNGRAVKDLLQRKRLQQEAVLPYMVYRHFLREVIQNLENDNFNWEAIGNLSDFISTAGSSTIPAGNTLTTSVTPNLMGSRVSQDYPPDISQVQLRDNHPTRDESSYVQYYESERIGGCEIDTSNSPFAQDVVAFISAMVASPPVNSYGDFVNQSLSACYSAWLRRFYNPTIWCIFSTYSTVLYFASVISSIRRISLAMMLGKIYGQFYINTETLDMSIIDGLRPIVELREVWTILWSIIAVSVFNLSILFLLVIWQTLIPSLPKTKHTAFIIYISLFFVLDQVCDIIHCHLAVYHEQNCRFPEVSIDFTNSTNTWLNLLIVNQVYSWLPLVQRSILHIVWLVIRLAFYSSEQMINDMSNDNRLGLFAVYFSILAIATIYTSAHRRHTFSVTVGSVILVSDYIFQGVAWTLVMGSDASHESMGRCSTIPVSRRIQSTFKSFTESSHMPKGNGGVQSRFRSQEY